VTETEGNRSENVDIYKETNESRGSRQRSQYCDWQQYCNVQWRMQRSWSAERVLIVEPDIERSEELREAVDAISFLTVCHDFVEARRILLATPPDLLVTNIFLDAYNGLHLAHLVACNRLPTKVIVYSIRRDAVLVSDARDAGAFVETFNGLAEILPSYLGVAPLLFRDALGAS